MIKAITFDFWYTLYKSQPMPPETRLNFLAEAVAAKVGQTISLTQLQAAVEVARLGWDRAWVQENRTLTAEAWLMLIFAELQVELSAAEMAYLAQQVEDSIFDYWPTLVPEAREILPQLAERYRLAIISDTGLSPGRALQHIMEKDDIATYFSAFTFSDELGSSKPHQNNFISTLNKLGAKPTEAVHIGDLLRTDIAGAKNVGMRAIQYVGLNTDGATIDVIPDAVIPNHTELLQLLPTW